MPAALLRCVVRVKRGEASVAGLQGTVEFTGGIAKVSGVTLDLHLRIDASHREGAAHGAQVLLDVRRRHVPRALGVRLEQHRHEVRVQRLGILAVEEAMVDQVDAGLQVGEPHEAGAVVRDAAIHAAELLHAHELHRALDPALSAGPRAG